MADAGMRLVVEGEKQFKAALASIDAAVKNNNKSIQLLTKEYNLQNEEIKNLTNTEEGLKKQGDILATRGKVLSDSIAEQIEKVDMLDVAVAQASEKYEENDKRLVALKGQLLDASNALRAMEIQQQKNNIAIEENKQAQLDAQHSTAAYDKAIEELSASVAANDAEIKRLTESGKNLDAENASLGRSSEDLAKKTDNLREKNAALISQNDKLKDSIEKQQKITENLAKAQEQSVKRYGEGSKEAEAYRKKLADATTQLDRMENELKQNEKAIEENNKAIENGASAPTGMITGLEKIEELTGVMIPGGIKEMIGGFDGGTVAVGGIVTALGGVAAKMADIFADTVEWSRDLTTNSQKLDLGTEEYQRLEYAATKAGFPMSDLGKALEKVTEKSLKSDEVLGEWIGRMDELKYASDDVKKSVADEMNYWNDLGVSIYDTNGDLKDSLDLLLEVIDAISSMEDETKKSQAAQDLFGKQWKELNTLVETGADTLREYMDEFAPVSDEAVAAAEKIGAEWDAFTKRADTATKGLILDILGIGNTAEGVSGVLKDLFNNSAIGSVVQFAKGEDPLSQWWWKVTGQYANGTDFHPGGLALVGERGPEIVSLPRGSAVYPHGTAPAGMTSNANTYNITIDAKNIREFNDIIRYAQGARVAMRRG
jgi:DNA repair exonuclease SbcCD ATPase subunit